MIAIVPAAGRSERFGSAKLLSPVEGQPLLVRAIRSLLDAGVRDVLVVTAPGGAVQDAIRHLQPAGARIVINPDPDRGMFSSIQAAAAVWRAGAKPDGALVLPGDMPFVRPETVAAVIAAAARGDALVRPTFKSRHGHPVALPWRAAEAISRADPHANLKAVLASSGIEHLDLDVDDPGVLRDVDMPEDLRTSGPPDPRTSGPPDPRTPGPPDPD
jgi:molybdenum cofactor cytidylyltransferase